MYIDDAQAEIRYLTKKLDDKIRAFTWISKSENKIIVTARAQTAKGGIQYDQDVCTVLSYNVSAHELGKHVLFALTQFKYEQKQLREYKTSDWPSLRASKIKSARSFDEKFIGVDVEAWQNGMVHLVGFPKQSFSLTVCATLGGRDPEPLGDRLFQVAVCCKHLLDLGLAVT
jgi:hypothetical protein